MYHPIETLAALQERVASAHAATDWSGVIASHTAALEEAYLIRSVEQGFLDAFARGQMNGTVHTCVGQELSATAIGASLTAADWVTSNHRCHGHYIAKTKRWQPLVDELLGKADGVCKGIGSSQHLFCPGFISNGPQGALLPVGGGIAQRMKGSGNVVVSFIGEGTLGEGITYEALNLASLLGLPQVFVCENNFYSQSTPQSANTAGSIVDRFRAFGIKTHLADTWDMPTLYRTVAAAVAEARATGRPAAIVLYTYRLNAHSKGDDDRDAAEVAFFREHDVLANVRQRSNSLAVVFDGIDRDVARYFEEANAKPEIALADYTGDQLPRKGSARVRAVAPFPGRVVERINAFMAAEVAAGSLLIGEDIADPYGGAFKATKGISHAYPDRVISTPISEAGLVGMAAGYCLAGGNAIAEVMFGDFATYCFDQIVNGVSKYHHMYGHQASCPVLIRMPMGGKRGYGPTHSQSLEKFLCGIDNVLTVALNALVDPVEILNECRACNVPTVVIESKIDYGRRAPALNENLSIERNCGTLGHVIVSPRYNATHLTIITYGETARMIADAYERIHLATDAIFDIVCLVKLHPLDLSQVHRLIACHQRVLLIEDGSVSFGITAEIAAQLAEAGFKGRIVRLGARPVPIPSQKSLELQCLISEQRVIDAIGDLLDG
jgi:2-oxoisovalerate dehydrogenase E1 component